MTLREQFEQRCGKTGDDLYQHVLTLALDDQRQYIHLTDDELSWLLDPAQFPPSNHQTERLDGIRERLLETMEIIYDIVQRIGRR